MKTAPCPPETRQAGPGDEHGRGLAIVVALAATSGCEITPDGKKTWFTLTTSPQATRTTSPQATRTTRAAPERDRELEVGG
jgi:hypothetical protein